MNKEQNPVVRQKQKELASLQNFARFLSMSDSRTPVEMKIEFAHKKFGSPSGFAFMEGSSMSMNQITLAIIKETENQIYRLIQEIREYEKSDKI